MKVDYEPLTEIRGGMASREQLQRMYTRYHFAVEYCRDKDILEVACGSGQGLRYIAKEARTVVGGDYTFRLLRYARSHDGNAMPLLCLDAHVLPFRDSVFDVVILYEAIYYLKNPEYFLLEARRILKEGGMVMICLPNKKLSDFHPSPHSISYYTTQELKRLMEPMGFVLSFFGDSPANHSSLRIRYLARIKKAAVQLNLMPRTLRGREFLKRLFFG
jgi:ubiquinone/menaquinone biosynthesis C-methylase UbiE